MESGILGQCHNTRHTPIRKSGKKKLFGTAVAFLLPPECAQLRKAKDIPNIETINDLHFPGIWFFFF